ncbi:N-acyl-D-amino-acid deacylase family protein [Actinomadura decatromicini]|uniref:D-aminoacylase n=1 Tax=Actinomadura decatromicini TaxID=2604572 RepID=A0A5D3FSY2_9ACTN|nr:D-aminoacylase [Actinomadura decatromicini]TYK50860.1 D-aminoacylase [Actinomadura decatromicini]
MPGTVIRGAIVVDGTGAPGQVTDVAMDEGRITEIGPGLTGATTLDADGLVLAPGFIDMHAHSDLALLTDPDHLAKVGQGVTTEVIGQDGLSYAPADGKTLAEIRRTIAGWNGDPPGFDWNWRTVGEYLDRLDEGVPVNACYLVPQGTVRMLAMGWDDRPPTPAELDRQRELVADGMRDGAVGMSSGLTYVPGMYADDDELTELCRVVASLDGFYAPHHRSYGAGALEAYAEMVELSRRSGCPLHLAHATMNFGVNRGRAPDLLRLLDDAIDAGCDITLDTYPYLPGSTTLAALLPSWASAGGPEALLARLADPAGRAEIQHAMEVEGSDGCHGVPAEWDTIEISGSPDPAVVGRTIAQLAEASGRAPFDVYRERLIADDLATTILQHVGHEENVRAIMRHPCHTGGSDGLLAAAKPHPRAWGTFPRYLGHYVRELGVLSLEECVSHLTGRAARRLRLDRRGLIRPGYHADLVLFDPAAVRDAATFDDPKRQAEGVPHVFVAGTAVVSDGRRTGALPGRSLRRSPDGTTR